MGNSHAGSSTGALDGSHSNADSDGFSQTDRSSHEGQPKDGVSGAGDKALSLLKTVKDQLLAGAVHQKDRIADQIDAFAGSLHRSGEQFVGHQDWVAGAIGRGAAELESVAKMVRGNDLSELLAQARLLSRRQPAVAAVGAFVAGVALVRFGKLVASDLQSEAAADGVRHE